MAIAIYLPVWFNTSWLDTSKIPYSNLGAANSSSCPRNYSRAFTAWFTWMSVSEGVYVAIFGSRSMGGSFSHRKAG